MTNVVLISKGDIPNRTDAEKRQDRFIGLVHLLQDKNVEIEEASAVVKMRRGERREITSRVVALGYAMEDVEHAIADADTDSVTLAEREKYRFEIRSALGVQSIQADLFAPNVEPIDPATNAEADGYRSALLRRPASVPERFMGHNQSWLRGWHSGQDRSTAARAMTERDEVEAAAEAAVAKANSDAKIAPSSETDTETGNQFDVDVPDADDDEPMEAVEGLQEL